MEINRPDLNTSAVGDYWYSMPRLSEAVSTSTVTSGTPAVPQVAAQPGAYRHHLGGRSVNPSSASVTRSQECHRYRRTAGTQLHNFNFFVLDHYAAC